MPRWLAMWEHLAKLEARRVDRDIKARVSMELCVRWLGDLDGHLAAKTSIKSVTYRLYNERLRTTPSATRQPCRAEPLDLLLEDRHGLQDELVLAHLAGRHQLLAHDVPAVLTEGREDVTGHPVLELPGFRFV